MSFYIVGSLDINVNFTFSFAKNFHVTVWKIMAPLILLSTLCACVLHWAGVI